MNHKKLDRLLTLARRRRLPVVLFAEGGGGRPGDTDFYPSLREGRTFQLLASLAGAVPRVGIASGRCFAGNAALLGLCDVVVATEDANIGMAGPAMIKEAGLGVFAPEEIGSMNSHLANGVVDIAAVDENDAVEHAKRYLSYCQGALPAWTMSDQADLRTVIPATMRQSYDVRRVIHLLADTGTTLELARGFGRTFVTALMRIEGHPIGVIANNPQHLGGAIDSDGARKAARFMDQCSAFSIPILTLCDTPGMLVGPDADRTGLVRDAGVLFTVGAKLRVPVCTVVLRKAYGLAAMAMAAGSLSAPDAIVAWPSAEFGAMGLEGAVSLAHRDELEAIPDEALRSRRFDELVRALSASGKALATATYFEVDDVVDPSDSRRWIAASLVPGRRAKEGPR